MKEELIFQLYKDKPVKSSVYFKKEVKKYKLEDPYSIYIRINKYQVKKYGSTLESLVNTKHTKEEIKKSNMHTNQRRYYRRQRCYYEREDK